MLRLSSLREPLVVRWEGGQPATLPPLSKGLKMLTRKNPKDARLNPNDFTAKYGEMLSYSLWGARWVGSALTKKHYIWFDHTEQRYVVEIR